MITNRSRTRTREDIQVVALSEHEWRISDRRIATDNALSLVGFIDKNRGAYEVMEFVDPVEYARFTSLEAAISYFVTATPDAAY
ncbi:hypothetical protein RCH16_003013 [Cryobacterium sp. MP_M5]|uniref:hypothetical protein n=1 Tax=unclassified Cryobacterium TaxID=2649013 RepID=UPI0018CA3C1C|nr:MULTISPECIES: hypothetical protein [unclassified Cryobacterium]MBG6059609.1 hypothetical protein [Cryobacterium sp. MP_M3]MEC5177986.1 hypothetical protein [Cryobacterium sp. MP_M5]